MLRKHHLLGLSLILSGLASAHAGQKVAYVSVDASDNNSYNLYVADLSDLSSATLTYQYPSSVGEAPVNVLGFTYGNNGFYVSYESGFYDHTVQIDYVTMDGQSSSFGSIDYYDLEDSASTTLAYSAQTQSVYLLFKDEHELEDNDYQLYQINSGGSSVIATESLLSESSFSLAATADGSGIAWIITDAFDSAAYYTDLNTQETINNFDQLVAISGNINVGTNGVAYISSTPDVESWDVTDADTSLTEVDISFLDVYDEVSVTEHNGLMYASADGTLYSWDASDPENTLTTY
ncbi:MAG: hypothetical protein ACQKBW_08075, partial [Puniceicoccales bacterium]